MKLQVQYLFIITVILVISSHIHSNGGLSGGMCYAPSELVTHL